MTESDGVGSSRAGERVGANRWHSARARIENEGVEKWNSSHLLPWGSKRAVIIIPNVAAFPLASLSFSLTCSLDRTQEFALDHFLPTVSTNLYIKTYIYRYNVWTFLVSRHLSLSNLCATCNPIYFPRPCYDTINFDYRDIRLVSGNSSQQARSTSL